MDVADVKQAVGADARRQFPSLASEFGKSIPNLSIHHD